MSSVLEREEAGLLVERAACDRWYLEHVANGDQPMHYDAIATDETAVDGVATGDLVEAKNCVDYIDDRDSRRRGRWWFSAQNHKLLLEDDGQYALGVYNPDNATIYRLALLPARSIDSYLNGRWTNCGRAHRSERSAQLSWGHIFHSGLDVEVI